MIDLSKNIKLYRKKKKYSQEELAKLIGVKQGTIANYEKGVRKPPVDMLVKISEVLEVTVDSLIYVQDEDESVEYEIDVNAVLLKHILSKNEFEVFRIIKQEEKEHGLIYVFEKMIQPIMTQLGDLWQKGDITIADEHAATELMIKIVDWLGILRNHPKNNQTLIASMAVSPEFHTLGIKMLSTYLISIGCDTIYLGNNLPTSDLVEILIRESVDILLISITMDYYSDSLNNVLRIIRENEALKTLKIGVGGQGSHRIDQALIDGRLSSISELDQWISGLKL